MRTFLIKSRNGRRHDWRVNRGEIIGKHERWTYLELIGTDADLITWVEEKSSEGLMPSREANDIFKTLKEPNVTYIRLSPSWDKYKRE
jgi:hypothetical protein